MRSNEEQTRLILELYAKKTAERQKKRKRFAVAFSLVLCVAVSAWFLTDYVQNTLYVPIQEQNDHSDPTDLQENDTQNATQYSEYQSSVSPKGVYIPAIEVEVNEDENVMIDMLAMVIYNDRVYVGEYLWEPYTLEYEASKNLLGEYLGTGNGKISCFSPQSEYTGQFTSNTTYDFYTLNGYDPSFRLAAVMEFTDGTYIGLFDSLNGIYLATGADLYEDLLHLSENYASVTYQLHDDWNYNKGNYKSLDTVSEEDIRAFIDTLNVSGFVDLSESSDPNRLYNNDKQAHLFFKMQDGTTVGIRLFESGYVGFKGINARVYVYMPGEIFDRIFEAATK